MLFLSVFVNRSVLSAFPKDRNSTKSLVYGVYVVEFVQTMLLTHDTFASFGYSFGDLEAFTEVRFSWLIVPIMGAAGTSGIFCSFSAAHREYSCFCQAVLLCIPNFHIVKVTDCPYICHLCSLPCS